MVMMTVMGNRLRERVLLKPVDAQYK